MIFSVCILFLGLPDERILSITKKQVEIDASVYAKNNKIDNYKQIGDFKIVQETINEVNIITKVVKSYEYKSSLQ